LERGVIGGGDRDSLRIPDDRAEETTEKTHERWEEKMGA